MSGPTKFNSDYLKENGIDAEEVKEEYGFGSNADIYNGDTITFRDKSGKLLEDTEMSKKEFFDTYGNQDSKEDTY